MPLLLSKQYWVINYFRKTHYHCTTCKY